VAVLGPERLPVWLNQPIPALDHRKRLDVIADGAALRGWPPGRDPSWPNRSRRCSWAAAVRGKRS
jgi:hypothetical protein